MDEVDWKRTAERMAAFINTRDVDEEICAKREHFDDGCCVPGKINISLDTEECRECIECILEWFSKDREATDAIPL